MTEENDFVQQIINKVHEERLKSQEEGKKLLEKLNPRMSIIDRIRRLFR
jgi:hypothetical protein